MKKLDFKYVVLTEKPTTIDYQEVILKSRFFQILSIFCVKVQIKQA